MGMFDWLKSKNELDAELIPKLPEPTRPAPEMPFGYCGAKVYIEPPPEISEPVITLWAMLDRDEWELKHLGSTYKTSDVNSVLLYNVYKEDVCLHIYVSKGIFHPRREPERPELLGMNWLTPCERVALTKSAIDRWEWLKAINVETRNNIEREKYKLKLGI